MGPGSGQGYPAGKGVVRGVFIWKRAGSGISTRKRSRERDLHLEKGSGVGYPFGIRFGRGISIWDRGQEKGFHLGSGQGYPFGIGVRNIHLGSGSGIFIWDQDHPPGAAPRAPSRAEFQEFQPSPSRVPGLIINPKSRKIPLQPLSGKTKSRSRSRPAPPCPRRVPPAPPPGSIYGFQGNRALETGALWIKFPRRERGKASG